MFQDAQKGRGVFLHGGILQFSFHQKWSKLGTLLQTDANETEINKKFNIFDRAQSCRTLFLQCILMITN
jgi:hypothetical protein